MKNGDWVICDANQRDEEFDLYFMFDPKLGRSVNIRAKRLARDSFQFVRITLEEWVSLSKK